jgi:hypothetical protein
MKQAISGAVTNRKGAVKLRAKTPLKNPPKSEGEKPPKSEGEKPPKSRARSGQIFCQTTSRGRGTFKEELFNFEQFLK